MTTQTEAQHYPNHDAEALGQDYINHISAMTTEGLRAKSSIAIQLAWRDVDIRRLEAANADLLEALVDVSYTLEKARIWGGMEWKYNPLHPVHYLPARDKARAAIAKHGGAA